MASARVYLFVAAVTISVLVLVFSPKVVATEIENYVPDNTTVLTIHFNSSWVNENVARNEVINGATIEGQAFAKALNTEVRTQLGGGVGGTPMPMNAAVGLRIRIDGSSLPEIVFNRRISFRHMRALSGGTEACEKSCYDESTNETCPAVTFLEIDGGLSESGAIPVLRPMLETQFLLNKPPQGFLLIDTTNGPSPGVPRSENCGLSYESKPHRNATSSLSITVVLRNIIISSMEEFPAVFVLATQHQIPAARGVYFVSEGVTFLNNTEKAIFLNGGLTEIRALVKDTQFNRNSGGAISIHVNGPESTSSPDTVQVIAHIQNSTFLNNGDNSSATFGSALSVACPTASGLYEILVSNTVASVDPELGEGRCQFHLESNAIAASPMEFRQSFVTPEASSSCFDFGVVTECDEGFGVNNLINCQKCHAGRASPGGVSSLCQKCEPGYIAAGEQSRKCKACPEGRTSAASLISPVALQTDSSRTSGNSIYGDFEGIFCAECGPGRKADRDGSSGCEACSAGQASSQSGSKECSRCALGRYADMSGSVACKNCSAGFFRGDFMLQADECAACEPGTFTSRSGAMQCKDCGPGFYAPNKSSTMCAFCFNTSNIDTKRALVGAVECADEDIQSPGGSNDYFLTAIILASSVCIFVTIALGAWVFVQRQRRHARMVTPQFPMLSPNHTLGSGVELPRSVDRSMLSPAKIIEAEFHSHDQDNDGHINLAELTTLVRKIMKDNMIGKPPGQCQAMCEDISRLIIFAIDEDGNNMLEKTEFTMLCLRVMRMAGRPDEMQRLRRMVGGASEEEVELLKSFFNTMNNWFLNKLELLQQDDSYRSDGHGVYEQPSQLEIRSAEAV